VFEFVERDGHVERDFFEVFEVPRMCGVIAQLEPDLIQFRFKRFDRFFDFHDLKDIFVANVFHGIGF
jgi:hypothetical protein